MSDAAVPALRYERLYCSWLAALRSGSSQWTALRSATLRAAWPVVAGLRAAHRRPRALRPARRLTGGRRRRAALPGTRGLCGTPAAAAVVAEPALCGAQG